jgi:hypothetical protein
MTNILDFYGAELITAVRRFKVHSSQGVNLQNFFYIVTGDQNKLDRLSFESLLRLV